MRCAIAAILIALGIPAGAWAGEPTTSANMTHLGNHPYQLRYESPASAGTDLEFATLTIAEPGAAPTTPLVTPAPGTKTKTRRKRNRKQPYSACMRKAKKARSARKRKAARRRCARLAKRQRARRSTFDVDTAQPGVQHTYAFLGTYNNGLQIFDVSKPERPVLAGVYDCGIAQGDVQVFTRPDLGGRTFVAYAADDGSTFQPESTCALEADALGYGATRASGAGTFIADVTDPTRPRTVSFVHFAKGSHNQTVHPNGRYLYNSSAEFATDTSAGIEIVDIADLTNPKETSVIAISPRPGIANSSHDISFSPDGKRAYSAAGSQGLILDSSDPARPTVVSSIFDPAVTLWHQAEVIEADVPGLGKRTILIGSDEVAAAMPTGECPSGALHMYDITGPLENAPVKLGTFNIDEVRPAGGEGICTAHVFQLHREQNIMLIAWYNAGTRVIDMTAAAGVAFGANGAGLEEIGYAWFPDGSTWASKAPVAYRDKPFAIYANDHNRGLDVWRFDPTKPAERAPSASIKFTPAAKTAGTDSCPC